MKAPAMATSSCINSRLLVTTWRSFCAPWPTNQRDACPLDDRAMPGLETAPRLVVGAAHTGAATRGRACGRARAKSAVHASDVAAGRLVVAPAGSTVAASAAIAAAVAAR